MQTRRRVKQTLSLQDRLASFAREASDSASKLPPGPDREALLKKARQATTAAQLDGWIAGSDQQQLPQEVSSLVPSRSQR